MRYANRHRRDLSFSVGDQVLISSDGIFPPGAHSMARKLQPKFYGPFSIIDVRPNGVNCVIALPDHMKIHNTFHVSKLRPFHAHSRHVTPPAPVVVDGAPEYFVQRIISHKPQHLPRHQATHYLVEWFGYPGAEHHTFEPRRVLEDCEALDVYLGVSKSPPAVSTKPVQSTKSTKSARPAQQAPAAAQPVRRSRRMQSRR